MSLGDLISRSRVIVQLYMTGIYDKRNYWGEIRA